MAEHTDTDRLNWVIRKQPEFQDGLLRVWLCPSEAPQGRGAFYLARGESPRECIDNALDGNVVIAE